MPSELKPCPFCGEEMEDRGYGAVHLDPQKCPIGDLAVDVDRWNRRSDLCASGQQVRALEWTPGTYTTRDDDGGKREGFPRRLFAWMAENYLIIQQDSPDGLFLLRGKSDGTGLAVPTLEAAKAAAQADYERRILAALTPAPQAEEQVREAAHRILELYDEALRWLLDPGVHDSHPDSREMAELRRIVGAPAHSWTPTPSAATPTAQEAVPVAHWKDHCREKNGPEVCDAPCTRCMSTAQALDWMERENIEAQPLHARAALSSTGEKGGGDE